MAEDLTSYLDSWAELLAANVEQRVREGAAQAQADSERLAQALDAMRAALRADLDVLRDDVRGVAGDVVDVGKVSEGVVGAQQRLTADLGAVRDRLATVDEHVSGTREDLEYTGSEVARANAALESLQSAVADLQEAFGKLPER